MAELPVRVVSDRIRAPGARARIKSLLQRFPTLSLALFAGELFGFGYLAQSGWCRSARHHLPVDQSGRPIPWITYPALHFLSQRLGESMARRSVFEYGSGNSTLWWSERSRRVVSCEHDPGWYETFRVRVPANVEYHHCTLDSGYAEAIQTVEGRFDVVVIDGLQRVECAEALVAVLETALSDDGIVLWDNSERPEDQPGMDRLRQRGFREVEFSGLGPVARVAWSTTVFYRKDNFLGL